MASPSLIQVDQQVSVQNTELKVESITLNNFTSAGIANLYFFDIVVKLKGGIRSYAPTKLKMLVETNPVDLANAKTITRCAQTGNSDTSHRFQFTTTQTWTVPAGVRSAFVTMAGGGGSGAGWRITNSVFTGHSGGYVFSHPINLIGNEVVNIIIGQPGIAYGPVDSGGRTLVSGYNHIIYDPPVGDSGWAGFPGTSTKIVSPMMGTLLECTGGSGVYVGGVDYPAVGGTLIPGGGWPAYAGSASPNQATENRAAVGTPQNMPGNCGPNDYGKGNSGIALWGISSGSFTGGTTPFGFGSGGNVSISGCYVNSTSTGYCVTPMQGRPGVVYIDVRF